MRYILFQLESSESSVMTPMAVVHYKLVPARRLPLGPVAVRVRPGDIRVRVDDAQIDPLLPPILSSVSDAILSFLPRAPSLSHVRIHRDHQLGGNEVVRVDISERLGRIDVHMPYELIRAELAHHLALHSTTVLRLVMRGAILLGRGTKHPAA